MPTSLQDIQQHLAAMNQNTSYDVIVAGSGPAGIAAALTAARNGAHVLLVEKENCLGGMSTSGLLNVWCGKAHSAIWNDIREKTTEKRVRRSVFSPEALKNLYADMVLEAGVSPLLGAWACKVNRTGSRLHSLEVLTKGGFLTLQAKVFIDATGDGDIAAAAGVPFDIGRPSDGRVQPLSLEFMVDGVDESQAVYPTFGLNPDLQALMRQHVEAGEIDFPAGHIILLEGYEHGTAAVNMTNAINVNPIDAFSLSQAQLLTRRQIPQIIRFIRDHVPGYANCRLIDTAHYAGVRESRRFHGDYQITETDIQNNTVFPDWVVRDADFCFGNHNLTGSGSDAGNPPYNHKGYTIPYRCFLPVGMDNLFLCGRNISGTHMAHSNYRVMPICFAMGEATGLAAAQCTSRNIDIRSVDVPAIQARLG